MATVQQLTSRLREEQLGQIDSKYRTAIAEYDKEFERGEREYFSSAASAYIEAMEGLRDLPQQLAALGLWGGITEQQAATIQKDYQTTLDALSRQRGYDTADYTGSVARQNERWLEEVNEFKLKNELADLKEAIKAQEAAEKLAASRTSSSSSSRTSSSSRSSSSSSSSSSGSDKNTEEADQAAQAAEQASQTPPRLLSTTQEILAFLNSRRAEDERRTGGGASIRPNTVVYVK